MPPKLNANGDYERWSTAGQSSIGVPGATRAIMETFWKENVSAARKLVLDHLKGIPSDAPYLPRHAIVPTTTSFIMSRGKEYALNRFRELSSDLIDKHLWYQWYQGLQLTRQMSRLKKAQDQLLDLCLHLRYEYLLKYRARAQIVPTTEASSIVISRKRRIIDDEIDE